MSMTLMLDLRIERFHPLSALLSREFNHYVVLDLGNINRYQCSA
jgi:hypothetical protein